MARQIFFDRVFLCHHFQMETQEFFHGNVVTGG